MTEYPMGATEYAEHATECLGCTRCDDYLRRECAAQDDPAASRAAEAQAWERQAAVDALVALWRGARPDVRDAVDVECGGLVDALDRLVRAYDQPDGATGSCEVDTEWGVAARGSSLTDDEVRAVEAPWGLTVTDRDQGRVLVSRPVIRGPWTVDGGAR